jgi:hypothetical protein
LRQQAHFEMSMEEQWHGRFPSQCYSGWHRPLSMQRFIGSSSAYKLSMIDIDYVPWVEYEDGSKRPVALIETAMDIGQRIKPTSVLRQLGIMADLPVYAVLYTMSRSMNPAATHLQDISQFRIKRIVPEPETSWKILTPAEYAKGLLTLRRPREIPRRDDIARRAA